MGGESSSQLFVDLYKSEKKAGNYLVSANNVFLDESVPVKKDYEEKVKCFYGSNVTSLSMRRSPDESADQINAWVEQRTRGKIQKRILHYGVRQCDGGGHDAAGGKASHWTCPGGE